MAVFRTEERGEALTLPAGMRAKPNVWQNLVKFAKDKPLEVWPESHWPDFALRQADAFQSYTAW